MGRTDGRQDLKGGSVHTPATEHILIIYPTDKKEKNKSVESRLTKAINSRDLNIRISGRKPVLARGVLVRFEKQSDVQMLEDAIKTNEALKNTVVVAVLKLHRHRIIAFDVPNDVDRVSVQKAACSQDDVLVRFPIKREGTTHWVLETSPHSFKSLLRFRRMKVGWAKVKLANT